MRVFITSYIIENGFDKGIAKNLSKNEVEVLVDLRNKDPEIFRKDLEQAIHTQFSGSNGTQRIKVKLEETANNGNPIGEIPDIMLSSQMLQLEQMSKFINVGSEMSGSIKSMSGAIDSMGNEVKIMGSEIKRGFEIMGNDIKSMGKQMKEGFEILAKAFKR